jgi:tRNA uridine 5-carboxymethylaminomethyl modification enzyme
MKNNYDVIVVGAGHAGCEAAHAAATMGSKVLLITMNMNTIGQMSCNPAMGGIAKGQIVREIDALGGMSGIISDRSAVQFRMLNKSKGPAMWSPRTQNDRLLFSSEWRKVLEENLNIDFWQDSVVDIICDQNKVNGVVTAMNVSFLAETVILTNGTFLNGLIHLGEKQFGGGRAGEKASYGLTEALCKLGFISGRMKTGTPPRIDGRTLDYAKMEEQLGDSSPSKFSFTSDSEPLKKQLSCHITYTNEITHEILRTGFDRSPMFNGSIKSIGPRYCPSIEDKINRFAERDRHQIFVEPEGWNTCEIYVNGFSTSLQEDIQFQALRSINGFEKAKMFRPGYAIEYDYFPPTQLQQTLETKLIRGLFFAGQINGTTGYEEAGCQGLMAGINAARFVQGQDGFVLNRNEAYIGVLIDDLINKGTEEPYRMFTSRAEYRILLRQDNADIRLSDKGRELGLLNDNRYKDFEEKKSFVERAVHIINQTSVSPAEVNGLLEKAGSSLLNQKMKSDTILSRPNVSLSGLMSCVTELEKDLSFCNDEILEQAEIQVKYRGYIDREQETATKLSRLESVKIPQSINYEDLLSLSAEGIEKLNKVRPENIAQASRISGVSPSDISVLLVYLGR